MQRLEIWCISSLLDTINDSKRMFLILPAQRWFWWVKEVNEGRIFDPTGSCLTKNMRVPEHYHLLYQTTAVIP